MNQKLWISTLILIFCLVAAASAATTTSSTSSSTSSTSGTSTTTTLSPQDLLSQVYVSSVTLDPPVFYPFEEGTIAVQLTNSGSQAVAFSQADLISNNILLKNPESYQTMIYLGPGNSMTYTLFVVAKPPDGNYFPLFTVASKDGGSIRYPIKVEVDSQDVRASFDRIPDDLAISTKDTINLTIVNPRNGAIRNIMITPEGDGATISPTNHFIQSIAAGSSVDIPFDVTPKKDTSVTFHVSFLNGNTKHTTDVVLPIKTGSDKEAAVPVINNIAVTSVGSTYHLTGDVNNAGLSDAKAMVLTVNAPAKPMGPYPEYAIGSLASDDFSGFELNFAANDLSAVPLQIQWKDAGGNSFTTVKMLDVRELMSGSTATGTKTGSSSGSGTTAAASGNSAARTGGPQGGSILGFGGSRGGGISSFYPVIAGVVILIVAIILWMKRKWIVGKFRKQ
jgi:archaellum component FlaF (FlaF/FlaG flagellin family)